MLRAMAAHENGGNGKVTIREIADLAGVSIATVSRVMNGRGDVSPETRELVQRVVRQRGAGGAGVRAAGGLCVVARGPPFFVAGGKPDGSGGTVPMVHYPYFSHLV